MSPSPYYDRQRMHREYEAMLVEDAARRARVPRYDPRMLSTWTVTSQMTRTDRAVVRLLQTISAPFLWLRRRIRP